MCVFLTSVSGLNFELNREQETAVKSLLMDQDSFTDWIYMAKFHIPNLRDGERVTSVSLLKITF